MNEIINICVYINWRFLKIIIFKLKLNNKKYISRLGTLVAHGNDNERQEEKNLLKKKMSFFNSKGK